MMMRRQGILVLCGVFAAAAALGCRMSVDPDPLTAPSGDEQAAPDGGSRLRGKVSLRAARSPAASASLSAGSARLGGSGPAFTVLPDAWGAAGNSAAKYTVTFTDEAPDGAAPLIFNITEAADITALETTGWTAEVPVGTYTVLAAAYQDIDNDPGTDPVEAARGEVSGFVVTYNSGTEDLPTPLSVQLSASQTAGNGLFVWNFTLPKAAGADTADITTFTLTPSGGRAIDLTDPVTHIAPAAGSLSAPAGGYLLTVILTKKDSPMSTGLVDFVQIYSGLKSTAAGGHFDFSNVVFAANVYLRGTLNITRDARAAGLPADLQVRAYTQADCAETSMIAPVDNYADKTAFTGDSYTWQFGIPGGNFAQLAEPRTVYLKAAAVEETVLAVTASPATTVSGLGQEGQRGLAVRISLSTEQYSVTYNKNASDTVTGLPTGAQTLTRGVSTLPEASAVTRTGYTLTGWWTAATVPSGSTAYLPGAVCPDFGADGAAVTLYAQWEGETYSVTYDKNTTDTVTGLPTGTQTLTSGTSTLPPASGTGAVTRTGYTLTGWWTAATVPSGSTAYLPGAACPDFGADGAAVTLYAQWTVETYSVTYNKNTSDAVTGLPTGTQTLTFGASKLPPASGAGAVTRESWTLSGWWTAATVPSGSTAYSPGAACPDLGANNAAVTLYAQWGGITYTIAYDGNGKTGGSVPASQTKTYGTDLTLQNNSGDLVKTGYNFAGWNTSADGTGTSYRAGETLDEDLLTTTGTVTLYAEWTGITYTIAYDGNGNTSGSAPASQTKIYGTDLTLRSNSGTLVKTGYTFAGWNTSADGTGTSYEAGGTLDEDLATAQGATVTLYARWTAAIEITWNPAGGIPAGRADSTPWTETKNPGASVTPLSVTPPINSGVYFDCWVDTSDGNKEYPAGTAFTIPAAAEPGDSMTMLARYRNNGGVVILPSFTDATINLTWGGDVDTTGTVPAVPQWGNLIAAVDDAASYTAFEWYVGDATPLGTSNPLNVEVEAETGTKFLRVVVTKNGTRYSKVFTFTVTAPRAPANAAPSARLWW